MHRHPNRPFEIALVTTHVEPASGFGGVVECTAALTRAWDRQGRAFCVVASDGSCGTAVALPTVTGATSPPPASSPIRLYRAQRFIRWGFGIGGVPAVWAACRAVQAVYVSGIATWPTTLAYLFCRIMRRPYVAAVHGGLMPDHVAHIRRNRPIKWLYYRLLVLPALARARTVHAASAIERDGVLALLPDARVEVIPNGIDPDFWAAPARSRKSGDVLRLCYVGRLSPEKSIRRLIRIWLDISSPGDTLTLVGSGHGAYAHEVRALALNSGGSVLLAGETDRSGVRQAIADSDFVVLPSGLGDGDVRENFGNALAEALAVGRPVMVTRGLAWDWLDSTGAAILFDPHEAGVTAAVQQARNTGDAAYDAMGVAARRTAHTDLDLDRAAARLWSLLSTDPEHRPEGDP